MVIKLKFSSDFEHKVVQGLEAEVRARFLSWSLVNILKLNFMHDSEAGVWLVFCRWCFVWVMEWNLGRDFEARFGQYFEFEV